MMAAAAAASGFLTIALENARQRRLSIQWEIDVGGKNKVELLTSNIFLIQFHWCNPAAAGLE